MKALVAIAVVAALASSAFAKTNVSVLGINGPGGDRFAAMLRDDLDPLFRLVPATEYMKKATELDKKTGAPADVHAVCEALALDAIVTGLVEGRGRSRQLSILVRDGRSGEIVARTIYDLSGRTLPLVRERVVSELVRALEARSTIAVAPEPIATPAPISDTRVIAAPVLETPTAIVQRTPSTRPNRGFYAGAGPSLMTRAFGFDVGSAPGYRGGAVAGIRAEGAVFPLALSNELADAHPVLASFGLAGFYEHAFSFSAATLTTSVSAHASRFGIAFVGRAPLGRGGSLTVETGFQQIAWGSASTQTLGVPDVTYQLVDIGLAWEHDLGTRYVAASVRVAAEAVVGAGELTDDGQYGTGRGGGLEAEIGLVARPTRWLWLRVAGRYTPLFMRFGAAGARPAHSAIDEFAEGDVEVGFAL